MSIQDRKTYNEYRDKLITECKFTQDDVTGFSQSTLNPQKGERLREVYDAYMELKDVESDPRASIKDKYILIKPSSSTTKNSKQKVVPASEKHPDIFKLLARNKDGSVVSSADNMKIILSNLDGYKTLRFNEMTDYRELDETKYDASGNIVGDIRVRQWDEDFDDAEARVIIERDFGIYNRPKFADALATFSKERRYNPLKDIIEAFPEWDGVPRCEEFLIKYGKATDDAYTRFVSRVIFDGAILRLYSPGLKFDIVPVLVGKQGGGKSQLVRYLALHDDYFVELKSVDADKVASELVKNKWIVELSEMSASEKGRDQSALKSFVTATTDTYRKPYSTTPCDYKRKCIFIGTTNTPEFNHDETGARRWYPVNIFSDGDDVGLHAEEIREYICQCYAEALARYKGTTDRVSMYLDPPELKDEIRARQAMTSEENPLAEKVEKFLSTLSVGDDICAQQIAVEVFKHDGNDRTESREINALLRTYPQYVRPMEKPKLIKDYGKQRGFTVVEAFPIPEDSEKK